MNSLTAQVVASANAETLTSIAPFTLEPLAEVPISTDEDVAMAFETARRAQQRWAQWTPRERARVMLRFHDLMLEHRTTTWTSCSWRTARLACTPPRSSWMCC